MKTKNNENKRIIDWKAYKQELEKREGRASFNEYESDLHTMRVKEGLIEKELLCPIYKKVWNEMNAFDGTNLDYFRYEKELTLGEFND
jgi:hypothetical protein